jgi:hypothetical protein
MVCVTQAQASGGQIAPLFPYPFSHVERGQGQRNPKRTMAHLTYIEDASGDVVDQEVYCSDYCATFSKHYNRWNGCNEISTSEPCAKCGLTVPGLSGPIWGEYTE